MRARTLLVLLVALTAIVSIVALPAAASHRSGADPGGTPPPEPTHTPTTAAEASSSSTSNGSASDEGGRTVRRQVDDVLVVTGYHYNESAEIFAITLENTDEGSGGSSVSITEGISQEAAEDTRRFGIEQVEVPAGETITVELELYTTDPIGAMILSERSLEAGRGTFIALPDRGGGIVEGAPTWGDVQWGTMVGFGVAIVGVLVGVWFLVASRNEAVSEVDLDPTRSRGGSDG